MEVLKNKFRFQLGTMKEIKGRSEKLLLDKGDIFIRNNNVCNNLFFLKSGSIKSFLANDGIEHTTWVYFEDEMVTSWHSYFLQIPSLETFKANEPTELISLERNDVNYLKEHHVDFVRALNQYYEFSIGFYDHFSKKIPTLSARDNYNLILENYPKLIQKASNSDIAAIIGVSRETISRIRAQS